MLKYIFLRPTLTKLCFNFVELCFRILSLRFRKLKQRDRNVKLDYNLVKKHYNIQKSTRYKQLFVLSIPSWCYIFAPTIYKDMLYISVFAKFFNLKFVRHVLLFLLCLLRLLLCLARLLHR